MQTVYHINGLQTVEIDGDRATGVSYCQMVLIGTEGSKRIKNISGVSTTTNMSAATANG